MMFVIGIWFFNILKMLCINDSFYKKNFFVLFYFVKICVEMLYELYYFLIVIIGFIRIIIYFVMEILLRMIFIKK